MATRRNQTRDILRAHEVLADILADIRERRRWLASPRQYAESRLSGAAEISFIAGLSPNGIEAAALHLDIRNATSSETKLDQVIPSPLRRSQPPPQGPVEDSVKIGLGYWPDLYARFGKGSEIVQVWEHCIENYFPKHGDLAKLQQLQQLTPICLHGVDISIGSQPQRLDLYRAILLDLGIQELSDHLAFTRIGHRRFPHFLPIWRVRESLHAVAEAVNRVQDELNIRLSVENIAPLFDPGGEMSVAEFLNELTHLTGCGILLDITNMTICAENGFCVAEEEFSIVRLDAVTGMHLSGGAAMNGIAYDAHAFPITKSDLDWLRNLIPNTPNCRSIIIERDGRRNFLEEIESDLLRVHEVVASVAPQLDGALARTISVNPHTKR